MSGSVRAGPPVGAAPGCRGLRAELPCLGGLRAGERHHPGRGEDVFPPPASAGWGGGLRRALGSSAFPLRRHRCCCPLAASRRPLQACVLGVCVGAMSNLRGAGWGAWSSRSSIGLGRAGLSWQVSGRRRDGPRRPPAPERRRRSASLLRGQRRCRRRARCSGRRVPPGPGRLLRFPASQSRSARTLRRSGPPQAADVGARGVAAGSAGLGMPEPAGRNRGAESPPRSVFSSAEPATADGGRGDREVGPEDVGPRRGCFPSRRKRRGRHGGTRC